jgi:hypothetical protein
MAPRFKAVAFYTAKSDPAHISYVIRVSFDIILK